MGGTPTSASFVGASKPLSSSLTTIIAQWVEAAPNLASEPRVGRRRSLLVLIGEQPTGREGTLARQPAKVSDNQDGSQVRP